MLKLPSHSRYAYSPIVKRQDYSWPDGKRLAFYIALNIEHFAFGDRAGMDPVHSNGQQKSRNFAWRDYGNRDRPLAPVRDSRRAETAGVDPAQQQRLPPLPGNRRKDQGSAATM